MSTPVKPPGAPPAGLPGPEDAASPDRADAAPGAFREAVDRAGEAEGGARAANASAAGPVASPVDDLVADVRAGRLDVDGAVERLVERALSQAKHLPAAHRDALASQLRDALADDPTLVALRRDLERASTT